MFGFHNRSRSLIPVGDIEKWEKKAGATTDAITHHDESAAPIFQTPRDRRNLFMIFLLFLADAIMAASLSSQIAALLPSKSGCLAMDASFLRSILEGAYFFGSAAGLTWGWATDRLGRRAIALTGLGGMFLCCLAMGFANTFTTSALLRFVAGTVSSAVTVSGMAMMADVTHADTGMDRVRMVAPLPIIAACGSIGPLATNIVREFAGDHRVGLLGAQFACAMVIFVIGLIEAFLLPETLPTTNLRWLKSRDKSEACEKAAFLDSLQHSNSSSDSLDSAEIEALNENPITLHSNPSQISIPQMVSAPSVWILVASFSMLSLHSSTFEILLPHVAHVSSHEGGMGLPCAWLGAVMMIVKIVAATQLLFAIPSIVKKVGVLESYRKVSLMFPAVYIVVPLVGFAIGTSQAGPVVTVIVSVLATLAKTLLSGAAQILVLLLIMSTAPDASSTGTVIGVVSISQFFKAMAVGISGSAYFLSDEYSVIVVNGSLWAALSLIALIGAAITFRLREGARVGTDIPEECLVWQGMFDLESDDEGKA